MSRKKYRLNSFIPLTWKLLNSEDWKDLKPNTKAALPLFLGKGKIKHEFQEFTFSYTEAERYGFVRQTFCRILKELINKEIVIKTEHGGLRGFEKSFNKYILNKEWYKKYFNSG